jgi:subtilisin family serine protease
LDPPALYDASFTVGATTNADAIASFSSRGPILADGSNRLKPDLCAPGQGLRVALPPSSYRSGFSGTSGSAPHVTGAVALLWSAAPHLIGQVASTTSLLERTAVPLTSTQDCGGFSGASVPNPVFGWGRLDVAAAVAASASSQTPPRASLEPQSDAACPAETLD